MPATQLAPARNGSSDAMGDLDFSVPVLQLTVLLVATVGASLLATVAPALLGDSDSPGGGAPDDQLLKLSKKPQPDRRTPGVAARAPSYRERKQSQKERAPCP
jgi:hypothetical protein